MSPEAIAAAFLSACLAELDALKPGNVHSHAAGHGMTVADFVASAEAAAPHIAAVGAPAPRCSSDRGQRTSEPRCSSDRGQQTSVGERILGAVTATYELLHQNTNLGIVLLCAPLAAAACSRTPGQTLREAVRTVLGQLDARDAALAFRAIALANPGGLGDEPEHDVRAEPHITLLEAMRIAAPRDRIAYQYASAFADIFELGLPLADACAAAGDNEGVIAGRVYWRFLTTLPDSHIARKYGPEKAAEVRALALELDGRLAGAVEAGVRQRLLLGFDARLKAYKINPGTSADLTVSTLFAQKLRARLE